MTTTATRKTPTRFARLFDYSTSRVLGITSGKDTVFYTLEPLPSDFGRAFRLAKAERGNGLEEAYNVCLDGDNSLCDCKGFERFGMSAAGGKGCKHICALSVLLKLGLLPVPTNKPQPAQVCELDDL